MSDPFDASTPSANEVEPDPASPEDPALLQSAPDLDEDELGTDPLEEGVEPAERWSSTTKRRPTPREQREGGSLTDRLDEERPDIQSPDRVPLAETRMYELDDSVDERATAEAEDSAGAADSAAAENTGMAQPPERHQTVLEGNEVEPTGLSASTREGNEVAKSSGAPEEQAERVEYPSS